jgi:hypothetical protein
MKRIYAVDDAVEQIENLTEFQLKRPDQTPIFSVNREKTYTVYSYGEHYPMYVYDRTVDRWYGNADKYSRTTSKHMNKLRPECGVYQYVNTARLKVIAYNGILQTVTNRMEESYA